MSASYTHETVTDLTFENQNAKILFLEGKIL